MKITVTQEAIDRGKQRGPCLNPISWAIFLQTGRSFSYCEGYLWPVCGPRVSAPDELRVWAYRQLLGYVVEPITVEIDLPPSEGCGWKKTLREWFLPDHEGRK